MSANPDFMVGTPLKIVPDSKRKLLRRILVTVLKMKPEQVVGILDNPNLVGQTGAFWLFLEQMQGITKSGSPKTQLQLMGILNAVAQRMAECIGIDIDGSARIPLQEQGAGLRTVGDTEITSRGLGEQGGIAPKISNRTLGKKRIYLNSRESLESIIGEFQVFITTEEMQTELSNENIQWQVRLSAVIAKWNVENPTRALHSYYKKKKDGMVPWQEYYGLTTREDCERIFGIDLGKRIGFHRQARKMIQKTGTGTQSHRIPARTPVKAAPDSGISGGELLNPVANRKGTTHTALISAEKRADAEELCAGAVKELESLLKAHIGRGSMNLSIEYTLDTFFLRDGVYEISMSLHIEGTDDEKKDFYDEFTHLNFKRFIKRNGWDENEMTGIWKKNNDPTQFKIHISQPEKKQIENPSGNTNNEVTELFLTGKRLQVILYGFIEAYIAQQNKRPLEKGALSVRSDGVISGFPKEEITIHYTKSGFTGIISRRLDKKLFGALNNRADMEKFLSEWKGDACIEIEFDERGPIFTITDDDTLVLYTFPR